jgi:predicted glycogen debranching enzyme
MISFGQEICTDLTAASSREWLETNGIGGFASATISGINTRRYHGLLVAAVRPPVGRAVLLSKFEEILNVGGESFQLSANQYPGAIYPQGFKYLKKFRLDPFPVWTFEVTGIEIEKTIFMAHGENTTVIQYRIEGQKPDGKIALELKPLLAFRDYHHLGHERVINTQLAIAEDHLSIHPDTELSALCISYDAAAVTETGDWYHNFEYEIERERGFDFHEDLYNPCVIKFDLTDTKEISVVVSTEPKNASAAAELKQAEIARREALIARSNAQDEFTKQLALAADGFIVARGEEKTVIAGYHWFTDWGRDTMIALPGLTLATGRYDVAESILLEFGKHISQGMLPNRFPDAGEEPEYNTVDATLWYFEAIRAFAEATGNLTFVKDHLYEKLQDIVNWHLQGTRYGIKVDPADGLLSAGRRGVQLTWMDAKIGDWVVTPRTGKAVEIQALWYNALRIMESFAEKFGDETRKTDYRLFAEFAARHFENAFWNETEQCLYDVVNESAKDASVRPNQIFAVSLPHTMLSPEKAQKVVEKVRAELLTPVGLRSLSPKDKKYTGIYIGSPLMRDGSYHQGTAWGWLIGPYIRAHQKVFGTDDVREMLRGFEDHLTEAGLGTISEIFDGDTPHKPRGCIAQAWSVAEVLRVWSQNRGL